MTQENKELLLKDICARLPYGVNVEITWQYSEVDKHSGTSYYEFPSIDSLLNIFWDKKCISIKPYLRPMSSMTEEEKEEYQAFFNYDGVEYPEAYIDWLNAHHFDYRGLIEKGLALEAPEGMYK